MTSVRRLLPRRSWLRPWPFLVIVLATLAGAIGALSVYRSDQELSTGTVRLGVDPGHRGALDIYVPLVDWGARFDAVRLPARLKIEARTIESQAIGRVAGGQVDVERLRLEARDAIETYIRTPGPAGGRAPRLALGALVALALRGTSRYGLAAKLGCAAGTAVLAAGAVALCSFLRASRSRTRTTTPTGRRSRSRCARPRTRPARPRRSARTSTTSCSTSRA